MFLFKRRRTDSGSKAKFGVDIHPAVDVVAVRAGKKSPPAKPLPKAVDSLDQKSTVKQGNIEQVAEDESPVKVVIPASELKEEFDPEEAGSETGAEQSVTDEVADNLLVKVNQSNPGKIEVDVPLDIIKPLLAEKPAPVEKKVALARVETPKKNSNMTAAKSEDKPAPKKDDKAKKPAANESKPAFEEGKDSLFSNLFKKEDKEEETPLDRLINSLPDISMDEVLSEAEEVKGIINESYRN